MPVSPASASALTPNAAGAQAVADLQRRIRVLERGGSGGGGGTASVADATTVVKGKLQLAGDFGGTASLPLVKKLTSLGTTAITDQVVNDKAHGLYIGQPDGEGLRWTVAHGNVASGPVNVPSPSYSFSRYMTHTGSEDGTTSHRYSTLSVYNQATSTSKAQPTGIYIQSLTESTQARSGTLVNPDATAFITYAKVQGSGVGWAVGAAMYADNTSAAGDGVTGCEIGPSNNSTNITQTVVANGLAEKSNALWVHAGTGSRNIAVGLQFGSLANTRKFDTGIYFTAAGAQGNPVVTSSYRDDGNATTSLDIRGTHTNAISIASGAGKVVDTNGSNVQWFSVGGAGQRWDIQHGTTGAPVTTEGPTFKISRVQEFVGPLTNSLEMPRYCAFEVELEGTANSDEQPVAILGVAKSKSTVPFSFPTASPDCIGINGVGVVTEGGIHRAIGGVFQAMLTATANSAKATGVEMQAWNNTGTDTGYDQTTPGNNSFGALVTAAGSWKSSAGVFIHTLGGGAGWGVGFAIPATNPVSGQSFRDDGNATTSVYIAGTHATAALAVDAAAGKVVIGALSIGAATKTFIQPSVATDSALWLKGFTSQSAPLINVVDSANAQLFQVTAAGSVVTAGFADFTELGSAPTAPSANHLRLYSADDAGTTVLRYIDNASNIVTLGAAGAGGPPSGAAGGDLAGTYPDPTISTTATPQLAGLGLGQAANTYKLSFPADTAATGGIDLGGDVEFYRVAANVAKLNSDSLIVGAATTVTAGTNPGAAGVTVVSNGSLLFMKTGAGSIFSSWSSTSHTEPRFKIDRAGVLEWGVGSSTVVDTNLYRSTTATLKTDHALIVTGTLTPLGAFAHQGSTAGFFNVTPVTQRAAIAAPTGGAVADAQSRTAIDLIRQALIDVGITA